MHRCSAVIFDLGRVLVDWDVTRGFWAGLFAAIGPEREQGPKRRRWDSAYQAFATGRMSPGEFHRESCRILGQEMSYEQFALGWCEIFLPLSGMEGLFGEVKERTPVGLLSDTDPLHWEYLLANFPWLKKIESPTLSFRIGHTKPSPECYLEAARSIGFDPQDCFFVDDLAKNVEGAKSVGMDAVRFTGVEALRRDLVSRGILPITD